MEIIVDRLESPLILHLLQDHLDQMNKISPKGAVHALDLEALRAPGITFWSVWEEAELLGCGALKQLTTQHAEIKSMRSVATRRRKGVASHLLRHILAEARRMHFQRVSLETGAIAAFEPARNLYKKFGFTNCGPFADYKASSDNVFMTLPL
ncbi:GNAT family N-acetyltransferase [Pseudodesulfovibrio sp.]|uniref:GNAT family N-acetyltransferase n=1 Tax=unclassified Pseudodesulfovibrio TaxID=2661612 RepID=UPI003B007418